MTEADIVFIIYILIIILAFFVSIKFAEVMIKKTGLFFAQAIIAGSLNLLLNVLIGIGWFMYTWGINEFLFFGGLLIGVGLLVISEIVLFFLLLVKRVSWIKDYESKMTNSDRSVK
ncbi:hypothetical protein [Evansella cellulosilytica]|uniref:Uncharacterized protein n=1 Tax=Evansella cellulosilytica (strain ATCC 21833 / DSM 2522 / FERM P-1141 / JCM 9156 / N-4) TaxID=649639 RepID=E6TYH2_EVAC2|nr:hypothetical protein [Evansella cellulosilytica]ADU28910.1 hypothetical protein Bcell_0628 [Evansella cellulosilytica DSM 2522]